MDNPLANIRGPEEARAALADREGTGLPARSDSTAASETVQAVAAIGQDDNGTVAVTLDSGGAIASVPLSSEG